MCICILNEIWHFLFFKGEGIVNNDINDMILEKLIYSELIEHYFNLFEFY